ncbi:MAG: LPS export ABC transporter permease LptG [Azospirillaceae bacterium]|nr:LPS export ABC transporter permease LptG [Azospirillaceae bacterium]
MALTGILSRYIGRQFVLSFLFLLFAFLSIIMLIDLVEMLRRAASRPDVTFTIAFEMSLFKLLNIGQKAFPFVLLFAGMFTFWRLTRSAELVVARAVGVSAWQFMFPVIVGAGMIGLLLIGVINPVGAILYSRYEQLENRYWRGMSGSFSISHSGFWVRQFDGDDQFLIHAETLDPVARELRPVVVFLYHGDDEYTGRLDATSAVLQPGYWEIRNVWRNLPHKGPEKVDRIRIPTDLTMERIEESFASPETLSFWKLPSFIRTLELTGLPTVRHRIYYQSLLAQPLLFCAMVMFAAAFSLRQQRRGGTMTMIAGGVLTGFCVFLLTDVIKTFGSTEEIPIVLAAWGPAVSSLLFGVAVLLHLEDG